MWKAIAIVIFVGFVIGYFHQYNLRYKAVKKLKNVKEDLKIPYDDYSRYQKAYVEYYKWLTHELQGTLSDDQESMLSDCVIKLEELFNEDFSAPKYGHTFKSEKNN
jgi:uncharacterized membrane-anchored protein YhcB (DUF1043 family)